MTPADDQPTATSERRVGEQLGELRGEVRGVLVAIRELRESNTREHEANAARGEGLRVEVREGLKDKASETWVKEHEGRIDRLESVRDEGRGAARLVDLAKGSVVLILAIAAFFAGKGGV